MAHLTHTAVMPGLVPGIHAFYAAKTWMVGTSPAMTALNYECSEAISCR